MYALDGVPLHNPTYRWRTKRGSNPWTGIGRQLVEFNASGRDGTIQTRGSTTTPTLTLVITAPDATVSDLRQLLRLGSILSVVGDDSRFATVELVALTPEVVMTAGEGLHRLTAVFRVPQVYWRDVAPSTQGPVDLTASGQRVVVFTDSTGPVRDALISVKGSITGLAVFGSAGTYFSYGPNVPAGQYLTFDSASGRAWTGTSAFAQSTEVTGQIANGPGPYFLELAGSSDPAQPGTRLGVTWTAESGASISIRGRNAYDQ